MIEIDVFQECDSIIDTNTMGTPILLTFTRSDGKQGEIAVEVDGVEYRGEVPVKESAKMLFEEIVYLIQKHLCDSCRDKLRRMRGK